MEKIYVSDTLEELFCMHDIRSLVRQQCRKILEGLDQDTYRSLLKKVDYSSGKCMAYPAFWLVSTALDYDLDEAARSLSENPGAIYLSLTTSIADDYIDGDRQNDPSYMMVLYLFLFASFAQENWYDSKVKKRVTEVIFPVIKQFLPSSKLDIFKSPSNSANLSSRRIGAFFDLIAFSMTRDFSAAKRESIAILAGKFGEWCSHLDDWIDIEEDFNSLPHGSLPLLVVSSKFPQFANDVDFVRSIECKRFIASEEFADSIFVELSRQLLTLSQNAREAGCAKLSAQLEAVDPRLRETLVSISTRKGRLLPKYVVRNIT